MNFQTTDHVRLDYTDQGEGQPVMLLTGFGGAKEIWHRQKEALLSQHFRVIVLDFRNQGHSQHVNWGLRLSRLATDVHELGEALHLRNQVLIGNSMGAAVIWAYLSIFGDSEIARIVVVDQSPKMISDETWSFGFRGLNWQTFASRLKKPLGSSTFKHIDDDTFALVNQVHTEAPFDAQIDYPLLLNHAAQDWRDVIEHLEIPMLLVAGKQSPYFDYHFAFAVQQMSSFVKVAVVPESGHVVMAEQSHLFNTLMLRFLGNGIKS